MRVFLVGASGAIEAAPDAIAHQATALADARFGRSFDKTFAKTNALRTTGTDALLAAAREDGVSRVVAQSNVTFRYAREGGMVKSEDDPLDSRPVAGAVESGRAMNHLDDAGAAASGIVLRDGIFYGAANDGLIEPVRKRQFPIVGDGGGYLSFVHLDDAAAATVLALGQDGPATTSSTTSRRRCGSGCRCSPRRSTRSRPAASRSSPRACSPASPASSWAPRTAA